MNFTKTTLAATVTAYGYACAYSDNGIAGYIGGGYNPPVSTVDKISFTTDTKSVLSILPSTIQFPDAFANSGS